MATDLTELRANLSERGAKTPIAEVLVAAGTSANVRAQMARILGGHRVHTVGELLGNTVAWEELAARYPYAIPNLVGAIGKLERRAPKGALRPQMPDRELRAWAGERGVADLLDWPVHSLSRGLGWEERSWCATANRRHWTVARAITTAPPKSRWGWAEGPPATLVDAAVGWLADQARPVEAPPAPLPVTDTALAPVAEALDRVRAYMRALTPPARALMVDQVWVDRLDPVVHGRGDLPCADRGDPTVRLELPDSGGEVVVVCNCHQPLPGCRARLQLVDRVRNALADPADPVHAPLREHLIAPRWKRALTLLEDPTIPPEGELGWAIDLRRGAEIKALACRPTKAGGYKTTLVDREELGRWPPGVAADAMLVDLSPYLSGSGARVDVFYTGLRLLAGHPRVYDAESRAPLRVLVRPLTVAVHPAEGGVQLTFELGGAELEPRLVAEELRRIGVNGRFCFATPTEVTLVEVAPITRRALDLVIRRGAILPTDALPDLLGRLVGSPLRVDAAVGLTEILGSERTLVRLELGGDGSLTVHLRVRPTPEVAAQRPGQGPAMVVARVGAEMVQVHRALPEEQARAEIVALALGLPPTPDWTWQLSDPEAAIRVVSDVRERDDADVEWAGRKPSLHMAGPGSLRVEIGKGTNWFGVGGALEVDGVNVPLDQLLEAMREGRTWVRAEGDAWVRIEARLRDRLRALADAADAKGRIGQVHAPVVEDLESTGVTVIAPPKWMGAMERMRESATLMPPLPPGLSATLRHYQEEGYAWMVRLLHWAGGAVLADDMGLGKTIQTLTLLLSRADQGPQLVVAPMSVGFNWVREAERFAPGLDVHLHHGADRPDQLDHLEPGDLLVTTYDILIRDEALRARTWATVVLDEAQAIKNAETQRWKAAAALQAEARVALTGTPIENRLGELWSLFAVVLPGLLGSASGFRSRWAVPIERDADADRRAALARTIRPFILRRLKREVATELPPRTEVVVDVELSAAERERYDTLRAASLAALESESLPMEQRRFQVLAALTRLRQLACAPRLVDPSAPVRSSKIDRLVELLSELRAEGRRALVFSQFAEQLRLVRPLLEAEGLTLCHLDGTTPAAIRRAEVDRFQAGHADAFLISLKAGGTGLNLTAASEVILLDPWWNPAVEDQAADRTHRIGQVQAVTIYRLVARRTVEEAILAMHEAKRDLAGAILAGTAEPGAMDVQALLALLGGM